jgi:hypothetical protein
MSVTDQLCDEVIHVNACPGTHVSVPVADALRLSERTKLPVILHFNGKTLRISWAVTVEHFTGLLLEGIGDGKPQ